MAKIYLFFFLGGGGGGRGGIFFLMLVSELYPSRFFCFYFFVDLYLNER